MEASSSQVISTRSGLPRCGNRASEKICGRPWDFVHTQQSPDDPMSMYQRYKRQLDAVVG